MRKFVWMTVALIALLSLLIAGVRAAPIRYPVPEPLRHLHLTDCLPPCWAGIVVGETTVDEAFEKLSAAFIEQQGFRISRGGNNIDAFVGDEGQVVVLIFGTPSGKIEQITLILDRVRALAMGDVLAASGTPWCLNSKVAIYRTPQTEFFVLSDLDGLRFRSHINNISILSLPAVDATDDCD